MKTHIVAPHGGELVNLIVDESRGEELRAMSRDWLSWGLICLQSGGEAGNWLGRSHLDAP